MGSDDEKPSSPARKLCHALGRSGSKKKKRFPTFRSASDPTRSMQLPSRFSTEDDSQADVSAATEGTPFNMNQSFFQILTATTTRMSSRFGDEDSDDEGSPHSEPTTPTAETARKAKESADKHSADKGSNDFHLDSMKESRKDKERSNYDADSNEEDTSPLTRVVSNSSAPYMSQILQAQAQMNSSNFAVAAQLKEAEMFGDNEEGPQDHPDLAKRLTEIFSLPETEEVISGIPSLGKLISVLHVWMRELRANYIYRVPLLASEECLATGLYVHYYSAYMFLRLSPTERCMGIARSQTSKTDPC